MVSSVASLLGLVMATFSLCSHMVFPLCMHIPGSLPPGVSLFSQRLHRKYTSTPACSSLSFLFFPTPRGNYSILSHRVWESQRSIFSIPWVRTPGSSVHHYLPGISVWEVGKENLSLYIGEHPASTCSPHSSSFPQQSLLTFSGLCSFIMIFVLVVGHPYESDLSCCLQI